jgi:ribonuclease Z
MSTKMNFKIHILGSGSALPTIKRFATAQIFTAYEEPYLIDCGEGTQIQMRRFRIKFGKIKNIFISHLHGDHYFGIFGLLSSYNLLGRTSQLNIFAHKELESLLKSEFSPIIIEELNFKVNFHQLPENETVIFENKRITVKSFPLKHRIKTCGFLFTEKPRQPNIIKEKIQELNLTVPQILDVKAGKDLEIDGILHKNSDLTTPLPALRSYAFCSDTAYSENIIPIIKDVDLLYHEATFSESDASNAEKTFHSTASDAGKIAKQANAKQLVIAHFSSRYPQVDFLLKEAQEHFPNTFVGFDGMEIEM